MTKKERDAAWEKERKRWTEEHLGDDCWLCGGKNSPRTHEIIFGLGNRKRCLLFARLCGDCHGTSDRGAHGINADAYRLILLREALRREPDRTREILFRDWPQVAQELGLVRRG